MEVKHFFKFARKIEKSFLSFSCFSMGKATIQVEKLTVEERDYKIDKKEVYYRCKLTKINLKDVLALAGTETFTALSSEGLD